MNAISAPATAAAAVLDHHEITNLVDRLGAVLDEGRFHDMPALLTEDAVARTPGGTAEGRDAVIAQASRNHRPEQRIQHLITNLIVDVDGDRARARANLVVHFAAVDDPDADAGPARTLAPPIQFSLGEVYRFELARTADGWRFSRIETIPVWVSGTPVRAGDPA